MAPISYQSEHVNLTLPVTNKNARTLVAQSTGEEASLIVDALSKIHPQLFTQTGLALKDNLISVESNLAVWRAGFTKALSTFLDKKSLLAKMEKIISIQQKQGKETDTFFEFPCGIRVLKEDFHLESAQDKKFGANAYPQALMDYDNKEKLSTYVDAYALNGKKTEDKDGMIAVMNEELEKYAARGRRPATKKDINTIIEYLPGKDETEKLMAMQMAIGKIGTFLLGGNYVDNLLKLCENKPGYHNACFETRGSSGNLLFVQDCDYAQ